MSFVRMQELDLTNKRVLIRVDFNVPITAGKVQNDARILAAMPTIKLALAQNAGVILVSHLGRPQEGECQADDSLAPVAQCLSELLDQPVQLATSWRQGVAIKPGEIVLCENVRCEVGEKTNAPELAKDLAQLADVFVMDAFATAHRAHASTVGVVDHIAQACAGPLLQQEIESLNKALHQPQQPVVAIIGGAKVSNKLSTLHALAQKVDHLIVGGGIANTFLSAAGHPVGKSLYEADHMSTAKELLHSLSARGGSCPLPIDVITAKSVSADATAEIKSIKDIADDDLILDIGPETIANYLPLISSAGTIIWSGPLGVFELEPFSGGTCAIAKAIAASHAFSLAGGGDTINAIDTFAVRQDISYISTGGGAFLQYLEGTPLPAITALERDH